MEKVYNGVNGEALWHVLRLFDMDDKLLNDVKTKRVMVSRLH